VAYASESLVFEQLQRVYRFAADGTGTRELSGVIAVHDPAAVKQLSVLPFEFASSAEHVEIEYVRVRHPDGSIISTSAADAQQLPVEITREAPFYSDIKQEQIPVRSLSPGDHLEYKVRIVRTKPESPGRIWGSDTFFTPSSGFVALAETIELHVPKDVYLQVWSPQHKPSISQTATERVYTWQSAQLKPVAGKDRNAQLLMDNNPDLGTKDDPKLPDIAWTSFHSWADVGAWYRGLEGSRVEPDADVRARTSTLIASDTTAQQKTASIYAFVASQIRYIGVAFGIGRLQPHAASDVLSNQYGDCKDKSALLTSMLSAAGIQSSTVLIGAGVSFNEDVPSPNSFNHAINLANVDNKPVWLDATAEVAPYGFLLSSLRGKKALVIPLTGEAHIETTPPDPPSPVVFSYTSAGVLDNRGTSTSHIAMDLSGDGEVVLRQAVRSVSPAQWDQLMQNISNAMSFSGKVTDTQFSKPEDSSAPFHVSYTYVREKNGDWDNLRILPQMPAAGLGDVDPSNPPVTPIELGEPEVNTAHAEMKLPRGWHADLPAAVHARSSFATLDLTYRFDNGTLTADRRLVILKRNIPASQWPAYHQWFADAKLNSDTYIQLSTGSEATSGTHPVTVEDNPAAADLIRKAVDAELQKDWTSARKDVDEAQALNAYQPYLWSNYGYLAQQGGDLASAVEDYKRELAQYPDETNVSGLLYDALMRQRKTDEAIAVLSAAVDRNSSNERMVSLLVAVLTSRQEYAPAEKVLRSALSTNPDSIALKMRLGITLLHEEKNAEGEPMLRDVLAKTNDPEQLNNAAYALAQAALDLPLAEQSSRRALDLIDQATNNGETGRTALVRANLLVSSWDTYGWILFCEGKASEAEPWVRAAWRNGNSTEAGYHLALILRKQNEMTEALDQLDLAAMGERGSDPAIHKLIDAARSSLFEAGVSGVSEPGHLALQGQRTYELPRSGTKPAGQGWAMVELELTTQAITAFHIVDGDETLQPLSAAVQHLNIDLQIPPQSHAKLLRRGVLRAD
jgi:tetratricopeptide (TPR) repeat protein/transglutaminase-like putative cysteine protease